MSSSTDRTLRLERLEDRVLGAYTHALPADAFFLVQLHIWWDEEQNRLQRSEPVLAMFDPEAEDEGVYQEQRSDIMRLGFTKVLQGHTHDTEPGVTYVHLPAPKRDIPPKPIGQVPTRD